MESKSIVVTSKQTDFTIDFTPPINLEKNKSHDIALIGLDMYYSIPNIDNQNNKFHYSFKDTDHVITIPTGCYEIESINQYIKKMIVQDNLIEIKANTNTLKCIVVIHSSDVKVYFNKENSFKTLLGFKDVVLDNVGEHESTDIVNILTVNSILVHCSVIEGSYLNNSLQNIIYTFFPNVPPGFKIVENPNRPIYLPISQPLLHRMRIWLTDQDKNPLNTRGEEITIRLHLRSEK